MSKKDIEISPLRSLDDFLLGSARFQLPNYRDLEKWGNRVVHNLLYYQTNYFLMAIIMILSVTILHPVKMLTGCCTMVAMYGLFYYSTNNSRSAMTFKQNYPMISVLLMIGGMILMFYLLGSVLICLFGILLPISATFIHASLRLRNIKNKLVNLERVVSKPTPMGIFLESLGRIVKNGDPEVSPAISAPGIISGVLFNAQCSSLMIPAADMIGETSGSSFSTMRRNNPRLKHLKLLNF